VHHAGLPTWREAWWQALYGRDGFYRRESPGAHFRTSVHTSGLFAEALVLLARAAGMRRVVDVGAGGGELLAQIAHLEPGWELLGIDVASRPEHPPPDVDWCTAVPAGTTEALVVANEWLDVVPCEVVQVDEGAVVRVVHVDPVDGAEHLGAAVDESAAAWLSQWWDLTGTPTGTRAEVGADRDRAWAGVVGSVSRCLLVAMDYAHRHGARPAGGTLAGYRAGRLVDPVPDGSCDLTAHVALDSCAAAGSASGATASLLTTQRPALRALGVDGRLPPHGLTRTDPRGYVSGLVRAGEAAELLRPGGLGDFGWLVQAVGVDLPGVLGRLTGTGG
jgi:SAM-dependent MidA family methyltransferase